MSNIYFTSDTHYHHKNIVKGTTEWSNTGGIHNAQNVRPFDTLEEHDDAIVNNINNTVKENDILYHLGDWSFGGKDQIKIFRDRLKCRHIHLIYGNHDHHIENNRMIMDSVKGSLGMQSLFKSCKHYAELSIANQRIIVCHFAFRVWNKSHHGSWNLYGHSHGTLSDYEKEVGGAPGQERGIDVYKCMDVGLDTHPEFRPYHFDEIKAIMDTRVTLQVDHHNEHTN